MFCEIKRNQEQNISKFMLHSWMSRNQMWFLPIQPSNVHCTFLIQSNQIFNKSAIKIFYASYLSLWRLVWQTWNLLILFSMLKIQLARSIKYASWLIYYSNSLWSFRNEFSWTDGEHSCLILVLRPLSGSWSARNRF